MGTVIAIRRESLSEELKRLERLRKRLDALHAALPKLERRYASELRFVLEKQEHEGGRENP